ncbi:MAG: RDD family protein [Thermoproteota archaeon]|nr:RDD family protein [Thermoproteota archaeon]
MNESGNSVHDKEITLAKWSTRFWAWLIDFIIVSIAIEIIFAIAYAPLAINQGIQGNPGLGAVRFVVESLLFFAYWTYFESANRGQSIGKKLLKVKTTDLAGNVPEIRNVAIQSFGKAFLLPIDVLFGWIFTNEKRQRLFNRASDTIVIRVVNQGSGSQNVAYRKEE